MPPFVDADPDVALWHSLRARRAEALDELVARHGTMLVRTAMLALHDPDAADEVTQETLIAAWDSAPRTRADTRLRHWLLGIVLNRCRMWQRGRARRQRREQAAARPERQTATTVSSGDERLAAALQRLDAPMREVVLLRFWQQLSVAETAAVLGVAEGTVKSRLSRAVETLRDLLGAREESA